MVNLDSLRFDEKGLIPAIVKDQQSGEVLTLAYMNRESLAISIEEGTTCFWSRSRQKLWRKGETSGNVQRIVSITADCDCDALVVEVAKAGPACHTGKESCFHNPLFVTEPDEEKPSFSVDGLYDMLLDRKEKRPEGSYTTYLFEKGEDKILKKVGEECTEVVIASKNQDKQELVFEIADLCYHTMVLMAEKGVTPEEIRAELGSRHVVDKKVKQEKMQ